MKNNNENLYFCDMDTLIEYTEMINSIKKKQKRRKSNANQLSFQFELLIVD